LFLCHADVLSVNLSRHYLLCGFREPWRDVLRRCVVRRRLRYVLKNQRGEGYVDVIVLVLCAVMVLALAMRVLPVFIQKQQLDTFATELVREAEVSGRVGSETDRRAAILSEQ